MGGYPLYTPLYGVGTPSLPRIPPPYSGFGGVKRGDNPLNEIFV